MTAEIVVGGGSGNCGSVGIVWRCWGSSTFRGDEYDFDLDVDLEIDLERARELRYSVPVGRGLSVLLDLEFLPRLALWREDLRLAAEPEGDAVVDIDRPLFQSPLFSE